MHFYAFLEKIITFDLLLINLKFESKSEKIHRKNISALTSRR